MLSRGFFALFVAFIMVTPTRVWSQEKFGGDTLLMEVEPNGTLDGAPLEEPRHTLFEWRIGRDDGDTEPYDYSLASDRPDFTEASRNIGRGRIQLEAGYTYIRDVDGGTRFNGHSYPEILLRIGLFRDWFELRIGQNFGNEITRGPGGPLSVRRPGGVRGTAVRHRPGGLIDADGAQDLHLGVGLNLTEQKSFLPEMRLLLQTDIPTGSSDFTADQWLPGFNWIYGWEINDFLSMAGSTQLNRAVDDSGEYFAEFAQSFTLGYSITEKLGAYTEWFGIFPSGARDPAALPVHFFNGGFTFLATENLQFDIRAGVGLNDHADDFFTGAGFVYLY